MVLLAASLIQTHTSIWLRPLETIKQICPVVINSFLKPTRESNTYPFQEMEDQNWVRGLQRLAKTKDRRTRPGPGCAARPRLRTQKSAALLLAAWIAWPKDRQKLRTREISPVGLGRWR